MKLLALTTRIGGLGGTSTRKFQSARQFCYITTLCPIALANLLPLVQFAAISDKRGYRIAPSGLALSLIDGSGLFRPPFLLACTEHVLFRC